jgi:hypothetical protein
MNFTTTKTGAIICRRSDERNQFAYEAVAFVTGVPEAISDEEFEKGIDPSVLSGFNKSCPDILFRADVHSTSNEVQEQFEKLHSGDGNIPRIAWENSFV